MQRAAFEEVGDQQRVGLHSFVHGVIDVQVVVGEEVDGAAVAGSEGSDEGRRRRQHFWWRIAAHGRRPRAQTRVHASRGLAALANAGGGLKVVPQVLRLDERVERGCHVGDVIGRGLRKRRRRINSVPTSFISSSFTFSRPTIRITTSFTVSGSSTPARCQLTRTGTLATAAAARCATVGRPSFHASGPRAVRRGKETPCRRSGFQCLNFFIAGSGADVAPRIHNCSGGASSVARVAA